MRSVHQTNLTQIRDAQLHSDGEVLSVDVAEMHISKIEVYDRDDVLGERTAGQRSHSAKLDWGSPSRVWNLLCQRFGEQNLLAKEFELVLNAVPIFGDGHRREYTFRRVRFRGRDAATYLGLDEAESAEA
jgi:hypothetical protein